MPVMPFISRLRRMWSSSFQLRLTVGLGSALFLVMAISAGTRMLHEDSAVRQAAQNRARGISQTLAAVGSAAVFDSLYRLQESLQHLGDDTLMNIDIIDEDGLIVAAKRGDRIGLVLTDPEWKDARDKKTETVIETTLPDGSPGLVIFEPFLEQGDTSGWVRMVISLHQVEEERLRTLWGMIAVTVVLMIIGFYAIRMSVQRVSTLLQGIVTQLESSIRSVESGILIAGVPPPARDSHADSPDRDQGDFERLAEVVHEAGAFLSTQAQALRDLTLSLDDKVKKRTSQLEEARAHAIRSLEALQISEANLRKAQALAHFGSWELSLDHMGEDHCSDEVFRILGLNPSRATAPLNGFINHLVHPDDRALVDRVFEKSVQQAMPWDIEYRIVRQDQSVRWVHSIGKPVQSDRGSVVKLVGTLLDITERKLAEEARERIAERLRRHREEQEHLYHELHDGIIQSLYAIGLGLEATTLLQATNPSQASQHLGRSLTQLQRVVQDVRDAFPRLWPRATSKDTLEHTFVSVIESFGIWPRPPITIDIDQGVANRLTLEQELHVLSIVREAISNTLHHAKAHTGVIRLRAWKEAIRLEIQDDGIGFDPAITGNGGEGFRIMETRSAKLHGTWRIAASPGKGTLVTVDIPPGIAPDNE